MNKQLNETQRVNQVRGKSTMTLSREEFVDKETIPKVLRVIKSDGPGLPRKIVRQRKIQTDIRAKSLRYTGAIHDTKARKKKGVSFEKVKSNQTKHQLKDSRQKQQATKNSQDSAYKQRRKTDYSKAIQRNGLDPGQEKKQFQNSVHSKDRRSTFSMQVKQKGLQKAGQVVRFSGAGVAKAMQRDSGSEESPAQDIRTSYGNVKATKEGIKKTTNLASNGVKRAAKAPQKAYQLAKKRRKIFQHAQAQAVNVLRIIQAVVSAFVSLVSSLSVAVVPIICGIVVVVVVTSVFSIFSSFTIKAEERALTATWKHITELDTDKTIAVRKGDKELEINKRYSVRADVNFFTPIDPILSYLDTMYGDYSLDKLLPKEKLTAKEKIDDLHDQLITVKDGEKKEEITVTSPEEVFKKIIESDDYKGQQEAMAEAGPYISMVQLDSPFKNQDSLIVNRRFGYYPEGTKKKDFKGIRVQADKGTKVYAPMDGEISLDGTTIKITHWTIELFLMNVDPEIDDGTILESGDYLGKTSGDNNLKIEYKKWASHLNPGFFFSDVSYLGDSKFGYTTSGSGYDEAIFRRMIKEKCNFFSTKADKIVEEAKKAGVSPVLFAAIMAHESAWGTSKAIIQHNNPSGQMDGNTIIHFDTLDAGIEMTGRTLNNLVVKNKLDTIEKLGSVYCPIGADNDPLGLNQYWVPTVKDFLEQFGGTKDMSILWSDGGSAEGGTPTGAPVLDMPAEYKDLVTFPKYNGVDYNNSGSYPFGQCTWYAYNRLAQLGKKVDDFMGNGGEWGYKGAALGYNTSKTPQLGWAISIPGGVAGSTPAYGHVAFVEYVNPDGSVLVSECNVFDKGSGTVSYRVLGRDIVSQCTFVEGK